MKNLILSLIMLISFSAYSYVVPEDSIIKVYTKDGKQIGEMSRKDYKVVKIEPVKYIPVVVETPKVVAMTPVEPERVTSLLLGAGFGNVGFDTESNGLVTTVERRVGLIGTLGLCNTQNGKGMCGSVTSNKSVNLYYLLPLK